MQAGNYQLDLEAQQRLQRERIIKYRVIRDTYCWLVRDPKICSRLSSEELEDWIKLVSRTIVHFWCWIKARFNTDASHVANMKRKKAMSELKAFEKKHNLNPF